MFRKFSRRVRGGSKFPLSFFTILPWCGVEMYIRVGGTCRGVIRCTRTYCCLRFTIADGASCEIRRGEVVSGRVLRGAVRKLGKVSEISFYMLSARKGRLTTAFSVTGSYKRTILSFIRSPTSDRIVRKYRFFGVFSRRHLRCILLTSNRARSICVLNGVTTFRVRDLLMTCGRHFSGSGFVGGLLLSGLLLISVCGHTGGLRVSARMGHIVFVVRASRRGSDTTLSGIEGLLKKGSESFVATISRGGVVIIGRLSSGSNGGRLRGVTGRVLSALRTRKNSRRVRVTCKAVMDSVGRMSGSCGRTGLTLSMNGVFFSRGSVITCAALKVNHLVCRLPLPLYGVFVGRVFRTGSPSSFSRRALAAVGGFFRGDLGMSRASERLCVREGALMCELSGLRGDANLSLHIFRSTVAFGVTLVMMGCVGCVRALRC